MKEDTIHDAHGRWYPVINVVLLVNCFVPASNRRTRGEPQSFQFWIIDTHKHSSPRRSSVVLSTLLNDFLDCTYASSAIVLQCEEAFLPISTGPQRFSAISPQPYRALTCRLMLGQFLVSAPFTCWLLLHNTLTSPNEPLRKHSPMY